MTDATDRYIVEDGPFGSKPGSSWTDGNGVNQNGAITAIELRSDNRLNAIRAK